MRILDYFAPTTQLSDQNNDWDLGSSGPVLIPGSAFAVAGAKDGKFYVFDTGNLGGYNSSGDEIHQEWQATFAYGPGPGGFWGGNYLFYNSMLYGFGERDTLNVFSFNGSQFTTTPFSKGNISVPEGVGNDPGMSISSNGLTAGTGIVWAAFSSNGQADGSPQPGAFYAFDASNVSNVLGTAIRIKPGITPGAGRSGLPPLL